MGLAASRQRDVREPYETLIRHSADAASVRCAAALVPARKLEGLLDALVRGEALQLEAAGRQIFEDNTVSLRTSAALERPLNPLRLAAIVRYEEGFPNRRRRSAPTRRQVAEPRRKLIVRCLQRHAHSLLRPERGMQRDAFLRHAKGGARRGDEAQHRGTKPEHERQELRRVPVGRIDRAGKLRGFVQAR